ncbi:non-canonical purine NTP pyrophosphatase [Candidatus Dependentiae bacterium]|nr:non-canonical purine NTP pyrophosphatase [Candidatus Dependentiae bacterium]
MSKMLLIATNNPGKFHELSSRISKFLPTTSLKEVGITDDVEEIGLTFEENAGIKARFFAERAHMMTLADDSGLCIDALHGAPGIYSKRFAGENATDEQRIAKALELMKDIPEGKRTASFVAALAVAHLDGTIHYYRGTLDGFISREQKGKLIPGLPYKTIFFLPEYGKTLAELDEENISYVCLRDKAIEKLLADLK